MMQTFLVEGDKISDYGKFLVCKSNPQTYHFSNKNPYTVVLYNNKSIGTLSMVAHACNLGTDGECRKDCCKFQASLSIVTFRTPWLQG